MHEDVVAPYFVEQEPLGRLIEKGNQVPGKQARTPEEDSQGEVLKKGPHPAE